MASRQCGSLVTNIAMFAFESVTCWVLTSILSCLAISWMSASNFLTSMGLANEVSRYMPKRSL